MSLNEKQLNELLDLAIEAANKAGDIIARHQGGVIETQSKAGGENLASQVVTEIDHAAEEAILKILVPSLEKYQLGLLTEETTDDNSRFSHDYFWCIDPLDGTLCFSRNEDGYSTSIALVAKDGTPIIGVVNNPRSGRLYSALKTKGAFVNGSPLKINKTSNNLTLLFDQSYLKHPHYEQQIKELTNKIKDHGFDRLVHHPLGGAVMNGISTIEMAPAFYYKFPKKAEGGGSLWDFAASSLIQAEAGGYNSNYQGEPLDLNRKDSTFMNHQGVIFASFESLIDLIPKV